MSNSFQNMAPQLCMCDTVRPAALCGQRSPLGSCLVGCPVAAPVVWAMVPETHGLSGHVSLAAHLRDYKGQGRCSELYNKAATL